MEEWYRDLKKRREEVVEQLDSPLADDMKQRHRLQDSLRALDATLAGEVYDPDAGDPVIDLWEAEFERTGKMPDFG